MKRFLYPIMGQNDIAWKNIFERYDILKEIKTKGYFPISAKQIKEYREPRLMTKFDHKINLPAIFSENGLTILPVTRGDYVISSFEAYHDFPQLNGDVLKISAPRYIQSLMPQFIINETNAINFAFASGILCDFFEDENLFPTVSGRMGSGKFNFKINTDWGHRTVNVNNSQIEIDAAYEGINYLTLLEAKKDIADDFLIRQLYYPFRAWSNRVTKPVQSVFLVFSNGVFNLYQYLFENSDNYNSISLVKQKNYMIATEISLMDIQDILSSVSVVKEPEIPFPQANSMERVINLIELLKEKSLSKSEITSIYSFDERQTNYYADAGRYLGFIEKVRGENNEIVFKLSQKGLSLMRLPYKEKQLEIVSCILAHRVFCNTLNLWFRTGEIPNRDSVVRIMKQSNLYNVDSETTYLRRASTVIGWVNWILELIDE